MEYCNDAEKKLMEMYDSIRLGDNPICQECKASVPEFSMPVSAWVVGNHFYEHEKRVLFVGKTARSDPGDVYGSYRTAFHVTRELLWEKSWAYWSYTGGITEALYGEDSPEHIAFTNMVKCNDSPDIDTTSELVKKNCVCRLKVLKREISVIQPTHIVFYTNRDYDNVLPEAFDAFRILQDETVPVGQRSMPWMEAEGSIGGRGYRILRIGHPQYKKRDEFIRLVCSFVNSTAPMPEAGA